MRVLDHGVAVHRAAVGVYLHQYFITIHYIDSVYAFLGQDPRPELRMAGTHYLQEEIGHEVHELEACRDLGVPDHAIADATRAVGRAIAGAKSDQTFSVRR